MQWIDSMEKGVSSQFNWHNDGGVKIPRLMIATSWYLLHPFRQSIVSTTDKFF